MHPKWQSIGLLVIVVSCLIIGYAFGHNATGCTP